MELDLTEELKNKKEEEKRQRAIETTKKWREENPEKVKKIQKKAMEKYRLKNKA